MLKRLRKHQTGNGDLDAFAAYLVDEMGRSPRTAQTYITAVKRVSALAGKHPADVTADDLRAVLRLEDYAPSTKRGMVVAFHQFHDWGVVAGRWEANGLAALKTPKVPRNPLAPMLVHDAKRALASCTSPLVYRLAYLGLYAGLRVSESAQMSPETWRGGWLDIMGKGSKRRRVPVHPELERVRDEILSKQPSYRVLEVTWTRYRDKLGLKNLARKAATTHTLRRTAATEMYGAGTPWEVVAKVLGHGLDVTAHYARIPDESLVEAIHTIDYTRGEPLQLALFETRGDWS